MLSNILLNMNEVNYRRIYGYIVVFNFINIISGRLKNYKFTAGNKSEYLKELYNY